ncbi:hypothetical protein SAMN05720354_10684 [Nitrosospira sp. Nsp1]|nr:hypothetical protein SAMN05720354_10684 [Nitrosospira sp. Nsp1]
MVLRRLSKFVQTMHSLELNVSCDPDLAIHSCRERVHLGHPPESSPFLVVRNSDRARFVHSPIFAIAQITYYSIQSYPGALLLFYQISRLPNSPWSPVFRCNAKHYAPISNYLVKAKMPGKAAPLSPRTRVLRILALQSDVNHAPLIHLIIHSQPPIPAGRVHE